MPSKNNGLTLAQYQALATATPKYFPNFAFFIAGQTYTTAQAMAIINTMLANAADVAVAKTAVHDAHLADQKAQAQNGPFIKELRQVIGVAFSNAASTLAEFAIAPKKPRTPLTNAARIAAEAKAKATRAARGTKGRKQKAAITGNVTGVSITPIDGPTAPSATAQPGSTGTSTPATAAAGALPAAAGAAPHA